MLENGVFKAFTFENFLGGGGGEGRGMPPHSPRGSHLRRSLKFPVPLNVYMKPKPAKFLLFSEPTLPPSFHPGGTTPRRGS